MQISQGKNFDGLVLKIFVVGEFYGYLVPVVVVVVVVVVVGGGGGGGGGGTWWGLAGLVGDVGCVAEPLSPESVQWVSVASLRLVGVIGIWLDIRLAAKLSVGDQRFNKKMGHHGSNQMEKASGNPHDAK